MLWIPIPLSTFLAQGVLEYAFYLIVDGVTKGFLSDDREKKRVIWRYETLGLLVACLGIYLFDHVPYVLFILTSLTVAYNEVFVHIDVWFWWQTIKTIWQAFRTSWQTIKTRWEEYQQHKESELHQRELRSRQKQMMQSQNMSPPQPSHATSGLMRDVGRYPFQPHPSQYYSAQPAYSMVPSPPHNQNHPIPNNTSVPSKPVVLKSTPKRNSWFGSIGGDLHRKPLRNDPDCRFSQPMQPLSPARPSFKSKLMSTLGFYSSDNKPPGLRNDGNNVCFMNCVVQCLARSPKLVTQLKLHADQDLECSVAESVLINTLLELLESCSRKAGSGGMSVLDPSAFRQAVSYLNTTLVAAPPQQQHQQDAAEFFMWLMQTVHVILNKNKLPAPEQSRGHSDGSDKFASATLKTLRFIYGDLTHARLKDLKDACKREIEHANGLDNNSYAEPIQRLSDLEWLTHKRENDSVVDNLFTGQLVEAYHCLNDNHISVNMQTFNILPVPIVSPREVSGLVFLEDCFTRFCNIEPLIGQEGLECTFCSKAQNSHMGTPNMPRFPQNAFVQKTPNHRSQPCSSTDSAVHSPIPVNTLVSPIPGSCDVVNDSGFHDNLFKTSTPISDHVFSGNLIQPRRLRDAQRRCLLRQLPDCLIIQLMRFTFNAFSRQSSKIQAPVSIPLKNLDLTSLIYDTVTNREDLTAVHSTYKYELYGACVHLGANSTGNGHYICYCLQEDGNWLKFDDEIVSEVNMEYEITTRELRENAYMLFYKRALV